MKLILHDIETFLLNVFIIFVFYFVYLRIVEAARKQWRYFNHELLMTLLSGLAIVLCMTFPIKFNPDHFFDLRQVPFILGALYGGRKVAIYLFLILIIFRFTLDGAGSYGALLVNSLLLLSLLLIIPKFKALVSIKKRVYLALFSSCFGVIILVATMLLLFPELHSLRYYNFLIALFVVHVVTTTLFVVFIEKARLAIAFTKEMRKLEKLKTVSEIAASISHEVRNPLTVTKGFIQLLRDPDLTEEKKEQYIQLSLDELERAEQTITDYLTFAKPSLDNLQILDVSKELAYILQVVTPYAMMNNVQIEVRQEKDIFITGESEKLHQCLINIIKNGIESIEDNGFITLTLEKRKNKAVISITDTGTEWTSNS
ncbi:sensor histidine kinase [Alkalihalobacillus oceani]|uniref:ATP-binding protein n=1 Tax=Halalkalibacter oceani TaxID=1653776 RepID=UPI00203E2DAF|nr:sensor histidine kinase [Halalkalibacter oceani]MCM3760371.1 sensor histidine kinase [Halalkalibacter oceani]